MDIMQLLSMIGGTGGLGGLGAGMGITPNTVGIPGVQGINPGAPPPGSNPMPAVTSTAKRPFMDRLAMQLFQSQNPGQESNPDQRRNAMLMLGLGMLGAGGQGKGLGEGLLGAYQGASGNFQGAMDRAFTSAERKRLEEKEDKRRAEDIDWRKLELTTSSAERMADRRSAEKRSVGSQADDMARARTAQLRLEQEQEDRALLKPIEDKLRRGEPLTAEEKDLYQLIRTGRQPSFNPYSMMFPGGAGFGGGMGNGMGAPGGNPLLTDPRLNF